MTRSLSPLSSLLLPAAAAALALAGCHTLPPPAPAAPVAKLPSTYWLVGEPMPVFTSWQAQCERKTVSFGAKHPSKEEREQESLIMLGGVFFPPLLLSLMAWDSKTVACDKQRYDVEVLCTRACDAPQGSVRLAATGLVPVTVREPGQTWISVKIGNAITNQRTESALEVIAIAAGEIDLECFDATAQRYRPCAERALDPAHPFVRAAYRGRPFRTDIDMKDPAPGIFTVLLSEVPAVRAEISLAQAMAVETLDPGTYEVELRVRHAPAGNPVRVKRSVRVAAPAPSPSPAPSPETTPAIALASAPQDR